MFSLMWVIVIVRAKYYFDVAEGSAQILKSSTLA